MTRMNRTIVKPILQAVLLTALLVFALPQMTNAEVPADAPIRLFMDDVEITGEQGPMIQKGRTLVPLRLVSEKLGAEVVWNDLSRTVRITKGSRSVLLRIDSHLVEYANNGASYQLCDVAPFIINERTYVPLRLVGNALGVAVSWDNGQRIVAIDSSGKSEITSFFNMKISSLNPEQVITGQTVLQAFYPTEAPFGASEIKFLIVDPKTGTGIVAVRGSQLTASYKWLPDMRENGERLLIAAAYDANGAFLSGDVIPIQVAVVPKVSINGIIQDQIIDGAITLSADLNFSAAYVRYRIFNEDSGKIFLSPETDPWGEYKWTPMMEDNGSLVITAVAYDQNGNAYDGLDIKAQAEVSRKLSLLGVSAGKTIDGPVSLSASRNFQVSETEYLLIDSATGVETLLAKTGYAAYNWFPGPKQKGAGQLMVRVKDTSGEIFSSSKISVSISGTPRLLLTGIGPGQVITDTVKIKASSNVQITSIQYILINTKTGTRQVIGETAPQTTGAANSSPAEFAFTPDPSYSGAYKIQAEATYGSGEKITSEGISVTIFNGKTYSAVPIIQKDQFIGFASALAQNSMAKTGMSAALQTAQAILESGWGQSIPVDKYSGQISYNLFGIKGSATAGSVTSNTWEEYNGVAYRIEDEFRAYHNTTESWLNHKNLLLTASRYGIFRDVMHDSTQGAWALRRAGYATDSKYPIKLMTIIKQYDLEKLDLIKI